MKPTQRKKRGWEESKVGPWSQRKVRPFLRGTVSINSRAVGFISDEKNKDDIMIETPNLNTALNRDEVEVALLKGRVRGRRIGRVVRIIKRAKTQFVGTIEEQGTRMVLVPDDFRMYAPMVIPRPPREAHKGLKALARITEWKTGKEPVGELVTVIGEKGEHETEMRSILLEKGFESGFPEEVEREAETVSKTGWPISPAEIARRRDFRDATLFTIDPKDAKDFDDALSFRKLSNSEVKDEGLKIKDSLYEVGVHIADVSHYVREGTALDREAKARGTSVYLVDRTIPMLPHALSNDLCSLNEKVDRLAFSAVFEMDENGRVYKRWFGKSIIHSKKRLTYEEAQTLIDSSSPSSAPFKGEVPSHRGEGVSKGENEGESDNPPSVPLLERGEERDMAEALRTLNRIAKKLRGEKMKKGAIDFEHDEVGFELDREGHPLRVFKKERLDAHKLVEEFMLLANREVAEFLFKAGKERGLPSLYRIHDVPDREKITELRAFVRALGHELPMGKGGKISGRDLQALFQKIEGKAEEGLIKTAAIRSMAKAIYSTENIGHFGLAFEYYTHFTSPIRRYPDLLVHRLLETTLTKHRLPTAQFARLESIADAATEREIAASEAERDSIKLKQVEFMEQFVGEEFAGTISGVTEWGIYIEEENTAAEGMVRIRDLKDDYYRLDEKNYCLMGDRTKKKYALGDKVRFRVTGADLERKTLDYRLV